MAAEQCDRGDSDLIEPHDTPWAFDDDKSVWVERPDAVEIVEQMVFWQPWREFPFPLRSDLLGVEPTCGIAEGHPLGIVETDADSVLEESSATVETRLETACSVRVDRLDVEEVDVGIEWDAAAEGREGLDRPIAADGLGEGDGCEGTVGQRAEVAGDLGVGAPVESSDELDDVAPSVTCGETSPEVLAPRDHESSWVVAVVNRAGAVERVLLSMHASEQTAVGEDLFDRDASFEVAESQRVRNHVCRVFPVSVSALL